MSPKVVVPFIALCAFCGLAVACEGGPGTPDFPPTGGNEPVGNPREPSSSGRESPGSSLGGTRSATTAEPGTPKPRPSGDDDPTPSKAGCVPCDQDYTCRVSVDGGVSATSSAKLTSKDGKCIEETGYEFACDATLKSPSGAVIGTWAATATGFSFCIEASVSYCGDCSAP